MQLTCLIKPRSRSDSVSVNPDGSLRVRIKAPPVDGKANEYLVKYLAEVFRIPRKNIEIISGFTGPRKRISITADETLIRRTLQYQDKS